jgi:ABC-type multidrug transport system ATPase subunit
VLDEPTSGMDSLTSFIIINELRNLAKGGKTVFLTIHQPNSEIYALFDNLMLMIEGKIIYQGSANESFDYFSKHFGLDCPEF